MVSLGSAIALIVLAISAGGVLAFIGRRGSSWTALLTAFATVAAAVVALLELLPTSVSSIGLWAWLVAAVGALGPTALERFIPSRDEHAHSHHAPTTVLAVGYAAVLVHQAGEGMAIASLAGLGLLSLPIVVGIVSHTVPLAMVVALRVLEESDDAHRHRKRKTSAALLGVAGATVLGGFGGAVAGAGHLEALKPWIFAFVAGLLLHALLHDGHNHGQASPRERPMRIAGALLGLSYAVHPLFEHGAHDAHGGAHGLEHAAHPDLVLPGALLVVLTARVIWRAFARHQEHS